MTDTVLAQLATLKTAPIGALKDKWRELFDREPPPYNRRFLEHRLAYRIQELAYGGLKPETLKRLRALGEELDGGDPTRRRAPRGAGMGCLLHFRNGEDGGFHVAGAAFELGGFRRVVAFEVEIGAVVGDFRGVGDVAVFVLGREAGHGDDTLAHRL